MKRKHSITNPFIILGDSVQSKAPLDFPGILGWWCFFSELQKIVREHLPDSLSLPVIFAGYKLTDSFILPMKLGSLKARSECCLRSNSSNYCRQLVICNWRPCKLGLPVHLKRFVLSVQYDIIDKHYHSMAHMSTQSVATCLWETSDKQTGLACWIRANGGISYISRSSHYDYLQCLNFEPKCL